MAANDFSSTYEAQGLMVDFQEREPIVAPFAVDQTQLLSKKQQKADIESMAKAAYIDPNKIHPKLMPLYQEVANEELAKIAEAYRTGKSPVEIEQMKFQTKYKLGQYVAQSEMINKWLKDSSKFNDEFTNKGREFFSTKPGDFTNIDPEVAALVGIDIDPDTNTVMAAYTGNFDLPTYRRTQISSAQPSEPRMKDGQYVVDYVPGVGGKSYQALQTIVPTPAVKQMKEEEFNTGGNRLAIEYGPDYRKQFPGQPIYKDLRTRTYSDDFLKYIRQKQDEDWEEVRMGRIGTEPMTGKGDTYNIIGGIGAPTDFEPQDITIETFAYGATGRADPVVAQMYGMGTVKPFNIQLRSGDYISNDGTRQPSDKSHEVNVSQMGVALVHKPGTTVSVYVDGKEETKDIAGSIVPTETKYKLVPYGYGAMNKPIAYTWVVAGPNEEGVTAEQLALSTGKAEYKVVGIGSDKSNGKPVTIANLGLLKGAIRGTLGENDYKAFEQQYSAASKRQAQIKAEAAAKEKEAKQAVVEYMKRQGYQPGNTIRGYNMVTAEDYQRLSGGGTRGTSTTAPAATGKKVISVQQYKALPLSERGKYRKVINGYELK